jgi:hypothetical protein
MRTTRLPCLARTSLALLAASAFSATARSTLWNWSYSGTGIIAAGTFTTGDTPDANGAFLITAITGTRNGSLNTGLQPPGTAIPGNEPFAVDDLVFLGPGPQLSLDGFGFATADGNFANAFFADFLSSPGYLEFFSTPPFTDDGQGFGDSELPIQFNATSVPEPNSLVLTLTAFAIGAFWRTSRKSARRAIMQSEAQARTRGKPMIRFVTLRNSKRASKHGVTRPPCDSPQYRQSEM